MTNDDQPKAKPVSDPDPAQPATMPDDDDDTPDPEEVAFLAAYDPGAFERPSVAVDVALHQGAAAEQLRRHGGGRGGGGVGRDGH